MTFAPWKDNSGGHHHQLNFNAGGIFYRNGLPDSQSWNSWTRILTESDLMKLKVVDSRSINNPPNFYNHEVKFELKSRQAINVPGSGSYSGLMTFAPWKDNSGGHHHQLNFNAGGIFYRNGSPDGQNWNSWNKILTENTDGNVGIGTINPTAKLSVNGKIHTKEVRVDLNLSDWADFVFEENYNLPTLKEVENYIKEKGHLKDIPSAKEVEKNGVYLGAMDTKLLQKIEELTLYAIQQEKKIERLEKQNSRIKDLEVLVQKLLKNKN